MICEDDIHRPRKVSKARTQIKWTIKDEDPVALYRDLGIIGEIPYDELAENKKNSGKYVNIEDGNTSPKTQNDTKPSRLIQQSCQRKRSRESQQVIFTPKKKFKINLDVCSSSENIYHIDKEIGKFTYLGIVYFVNLLFNYLLFI